MHTTTIKTTHTHTKKKESPENIERSSHSFHSNKKHEHFTLEILFFPFLLFRPLAINNCEKTVEKKRLLVAYTS